MEPEIILQIVNLAVMSCIVLFRKYLFSYVTEKGKNLATKEDIEEITDKIESVKHSYAQQLDSTRAELSAQINTHGFRYEKEYEVLADLTALLVDARDAVLRLRPETSEGGNTNIEDKLKTERVKAYLKAHIELYNLKEKKRPFYPEDIYSAISEIEKVALVESSEYLDMEPFPGLKYLEYWNNAADNKAILSDRMENAIKKIRERVVKWDSLQGHL